MRSEWPTPDEVRASLAALPEPCNGDAPFETAPGSLALGVFYDYSGLGFHYDLAVALTAKALLAALDADRSLLDGEAGSAFEAAGARYPGLDEWLGGTSGLSLASAWRAARHAMGA